MTIYPYKESELGERKKKPFQFFIWWATTNNKLQHIFANVEFIQPGV